MCGGNLSTNYGLLTTCIYLHSGSVSSYNDDDYEVDENSDDEEQEDPNDYIKGKFTCTVSLHCTYELWTNINDLVFAICKLITVFKLNLS